MDTAVVYIGVTFLLGLVAMAVRMPPLVGFLAAGFVIKALGVAPMGSLPLLAEWGVAMLMFTIGLKLDARALLRREAWGTSLPHMVISTLVGAGFLGLLTLLGSQLLQGQGGRTLLLLGFALSFSSTVFAAKVLEERSDDGSLYGRTALAVLVIQDVAAVAFLTASSDHLPSPRVLLLVGLWPAAIVFRRLWRRVGRGELQVMFGVTIALVPGYWLFTWVGLTGELGALVMGLLLAPSPRAGALASSLFSIQEVLLVAFFLSIGVHSALTVPAVLMGLTLLLLLPIQGFFYMLLLRMFGLRNRTAVLSGVILSSFSEFGLIVAAYAVERHLLDEVWLAALSVAVAGSFAVAATVNRRGGWLVDRLADSLPPRPPGRLIAEDRPVALGEVQAMVLGMGRIGAAAYEQLVHVYGLSTVGVENNLERTALLQSRGQHVISADATDSEFWRRLRPSETVDVIVLAMPDHGSNIYALQQVEASDFRGTVSVIARNDDDVREVRGRGIEAVLHLYEGAGESLADRAATYAGIRPLEGSG